MMRPGVPALSFEQFACPIVALVAYPLLLLDDSAHGRDRLGGSGRVQVEPLWCWRRRRVFVELNSSENPRWVVLRPATRSTAGCVPLVCPMARRAPILNDENPAVAGFSEMPPVGIEPTTFGLKVVCGRVVGSARVRNLP